jgi:hypothetical protein
MAWIIAAREVREKARLFLICAVLAVVPFAATLLPGTRANAPAAIALVGGFLAAILGLGISAALGASTVARDLSEKRMSFYFTRPVGAPALWLGKASASLFVSFACAALIALPAFFASRRQWTMHWLGDVEPLAALAAAIVVVFFLAHVLSSVIRSRSPLLALDFLFLTVALAAVYLILRPLVLAAAVAAIAAVQIGIGVAVLLVLAVAPVWQLANGRSDIRRSHAALMRFLWPAIAIVLLVAGGAVAWIVHVAPEDVVVTSIEQPRRGSAVIVTGTAPHRLDYHATFLIDRATGKFTRIAAPLWWGAQFSDDGRIAVWLQPEGLFSQQLELLTTHGPAGITLSRAAELVLSGDGTRVAITNGNLLAVHELATGRLLASAAGLDGRARQQLFFVTPELVRVIEYEHRMGAATPLRIFELDVRARATRRTGERLLQSPRQPVSVSGDGARMYVRGANLIADGRTGETIAQLPVAHVTDGEMLHDGRVALIERVGAVPHLRTFDRDGAPRHDLPFPGVRSLWIAAETGNGKLILAAFGKTMIVVDIATGTVERTLQGLRGPLPRWTPDPRLARFAADQELVGMDERGKLVTWSPSRPAPRPLWSAEARPPLSNARQAR